MGRNKDLNDFDKGQTVMARIYQQWNEPQNGDRVLGAQSSLMPEGNEGQQKVYYGTSNTKF